jgi:hypothetical protein
MLIAWSSNWLSDAQVNTCILKRIHVLGDLFFFFLILLPKKFPRVSISGRMQTVEILYIQSHNHNFFSRRIQLRPFLWISRQILQLRSVESTATLLRSAKLRAHVKPMMFYYLREGSINLEVCLVNMSVPRTDNKPTIVAPIAIAGIGKRSLKRCGNSSAYPPLM